MLTVESISNSLSHTTKVTSWLPFSDSVGSHEKFCVAGSNCACGGRLNAEYDNCPHGVEGSSGSCALILNSSNLSIKTNLFDIGSKIGGSFILSIMVVK